MSEIVLNDKNFKPNHSQKIKLGALTINLGEKNDRERVYEYTCGVFKKKHEIS